MTAERKPFHVRCKPCGHEWPVAYTPMELGAFARTVKSARCPMCGRTSRNHFASLATTPVASQPEPTT